MSISRSLIAIVATLGLSTAVLAADENTTATQNSSNQAMQVADATTDATTDATAAPAQDQTQAKVDLNKASAKDLMKVKGLNGPKARAIVSYRKKHGDFKSLDDLKMVKGFKKMKDSEMKAIEDQLTIG